MSISNIESNCSVCLEPYSSKQPEIKTHCPQNGIWHVLHKGCFIQMLQMQIRNEFRPPFYRNTNPFCPECRHEFTPEDPAHPLIGRIRTIAGPLLGTRISDPELTENLQLALRNYEKNSFESIISEICHRNTNIIDQNVWNAVLRTIITNNLDELLEIIIASGIEFPAHQNLDEVFRHALNVGSPRIIKLIFRNRRQFPIMNLRDLIIAAAQINSLGNLSLIFLDNDQPSEEILTAAARGAIQHELWGNLHFLLSKGAFANEEARLALLKSGIAGGNSLLVKSIIESTQNNLQSIQELITQATTQNKTQIVRILLEKREQILHSSQQIQPGFNVGIWVHIATINGNEELVAVFLDIEPICQGCRDESLLRAFEGKFKNIYTRLLCSGPISSETQKAIITAFESNPDRDEQYITLLKDHSINQSYLDRVVLEAVRKADIMLTQAFLIKGEISDECRGRCLIHALKANNIELATILFDSGELTEPLRSMAFTTALEEELWDQAMLILESGSISTRTLRWALRTVEKENQQMLSEVLSEMLKIPPIRP